MAKPLKRQEKVPEIGKRSRGRPPLAHPKQLQTMRFDADVLEHFRAYGPGWMTRINAILRRIMLREQKRS